MTLNNITLKLTFLPIMFSQFANYQNLLSTIQISAKLSLAYPRKFQNVADASTEELSWLHESKTAVQQAKQSSSEAIIFTMLFLCVSKDVSSAFFDCCRRPTMHSKSSCFRIWNQSDLLTL